MDKTVLSEKNILSIILREVFYTIYSAYSAKNFAKLQLNT